MSASEFRDWVAYVEDNGPLDYQRRFDEPAALIAWAVQAAQGGKARIDDFLRYRAPSNLSRLDRDIGKLLGA